MAACQSAKRTICAGSSVQQGHGETVAGPGFFGPLDDPDRPEHHYRYDPHKAAAYIATTLAWAGGPVALVYTRTILKELDPVGNGGPRPRRAASARLDLALATAGEADEAASVATKAVTSGRVVPSNWWRAAEVMSAVDRLGCTAADDLREVYESFRPHPQPLGRDSNG